MLILRCRCCTPEDDPYFEVATSKTLARSEDSCPTCGCFLVVVLDSQGFMLCDDPEYQQRMVKGEWKKEKEGE